MIIANVRFIVWMDRNGDNWWQIVQGAVSEEDARDKLEFLRLTAPKKARLAITRLGYRPEPLDPVPF